jgi:PAS domain S-box-containing protein
LCFIYVFKVGFGSSQQQGNVQFFSVKKMTSKRKNRGSKNLENLQVEKQTEDRSAPRSVMLNVIEEALQKREEKYRELVENANSIILRSDTQGRITFFNEFAQNFFGYTEEEIVGKNLLETIVPKTETTGRDLAQMRKDLMLYPEKFINNGNENIRRNGERVWIAWTNKAILDQHGNVTGILSVGNDITERKQAEEERKILIQELQQTLEELQEALAKVKTLSGLLPICASCKKIRDDSGYWKQIEAYIREHSDATFTHGLCPECVKKLYPDFVIDDEE